MKKCIPFFLLTSMFAFSQHRMTMEECEEAFRKNNLELLAQQYNINLADADIMQAKIWDLPEVTFQANAYNPEGKRFFDIGKSKNATIQQLIYLGGKKKMKLNLQSPIRNLPSCNSASFWLILGLRCGKPIMHCILKKRNFRV